MWASQKELAMMGELIMVLHLIYAILISATQHMPKIDLQVGLLQILMVGFNKAYEAIYGKTSLCGVDSYLTEERLTELVDN